MNTKISTLGLLAGGACAAAAEAALDYGPSHAAATAAIFAVCGAPVLVGAHLLARRRARLGSLSRQFTAGLALVFGLALLGVGGVSLMMSAMASRARMCRSFTRGSGSCRRFTHDATFLEAADIRLFTRNAARCKMILSERTTRSRRRPMPCHTEGKP